MEIGIKQARNDLSKLLLAAQRGDRVFLTNRGKRVAEIVPIKEVSTVTQRGLGMFKGQIALPKGWGSQKHRLKSEKELIAMIEGFD
jgi:prevent-host-death family protein